MVKLGLAIAPYITDMIHIMTNPMLTSASEIVENAQRKPPIFSVLLGTFEAQEGSD